MLQGLLHAGWERFGYFTEPHVPANSGAWGGYRGAPVHGPWAGATASRMHEPQPQPWMCEVATPKEQLLRELYFSGIERFERFADTREAPPPALPDVAHVQVRTDGKRVMSDVFLQRSRPATSPEGEARRTLASSGATPTGSEP